jgi:hypothetical protein
MYISIYGGRFLIWLSRFLSICFLSGTIYLSKQVPTPYLDLTGMSKKIFSGLDKEPFVTPIVPWVDVLLDRSTF